MSKGWSVPSTTRSGPAKAIRSASSVRIVGDGVVVEAPQRLVGRLAQAGAGLGLEAVGVAQAASQREDRAAAVGQQHPEVRVPLEHTRHHHLRGGDGRLDRVAHRVPEVVVGERADREAAGGRVDEHQGARALGGAPERLEAVVAEARAPHRRGHLHAAQLAALDEPLQLGGGQLRILQRHRPQRRRSARRPSGRARPAPRSGCGSAAVASSGSASPNSSGTQGQSTVRSMPACSWASTIRSTSTNSRTAERISRPSSSTTCAPSTRCTRGRQSSSGAASRSSSGTITWAWRSTVSHVTPPRSAGASRRPPALRPRAPARPPVRRPSRRREEPG